MKKLVTENTVFSKENPEEGRYEAFTKLSR
jgi:hypothetical protein